MNEQINTKQNQDPGTSNIGSPDITPGLSMSALAVAAKGVGLGGTKNLGLNPRNGANTQTPVDVAPNTVNPALLNAAAEGATATQIPTLPGPEVQPPQASTRPN